MSGPLGEELPDDPGDELGAALAAPLVDHHVHGCFRGALDRRGFEDSLNESSTDPVPAFMTQFDSQLGFAVRRWCAPALGLPPHADPDEYWARRSSFSPPELARVLLPAAGVSDWLVDTGFAADRLCSPAELATWSGGRTREILRLETIAESLVTQGISPSAFPDALRRLVIDHRPTVTAVKSIAAYRCGFDIDWSRPSSVRVASAVADWITSGSPRLVSPTVIAFGLHVAADAGLPIQLHVGLGDRDLDLHRTDPMLLLPLLRQPGIGRVPVMLLHCYPFHRQAGYLAQAFGNVYCDVGLAVNHVGARSPAVLAESLELAPFAKLLYSSDGYGPPELHLLGALLWRRGMGRVLRRWVRDGDWSLTDAARVVRMIGSGNAARIYRLDTA